MLSGDEVYDDDVTSGVEGYQAGWDAGYAAGVTLAAPPSDPAAPLREAVEITASWLDAIIEESDPKPSELMAMVAGLRASLATPAPKEADRE